MSIYRRELIHEYGVRAIAHSCPVPEMSARVSRTVLLIARPQRSGLR
jgi:hypothetical protein